ncbi:EamA family transporter RarD [Terrihalobacillus insolitus]|uniref:EamA family transporter RarD n=1 Tax=Terrihalobacillus insolitus TaxID=2950438 RepID=UPI00233FDEB3|nr:EamA family transporter RarD [Terrihalobacillus insolitus]MDC3414571.1 EamA family transporter RarD [Terrihalobacillus insolitus]
MNMSENKLGILYTTAAYLLWGFLPIYWKLIQSVPAGEILAHRIVWSFLFMIIILFTVRKWRAFLQECKVIIRDKRKLIGITSASLIISVNWLVFIWAVNAEYVVQASLGYYINPLISILLGMFVLKERLTRWQIVSFVFASIGVLNLTINFGVFPWISIVLALSFGLYGLLKKIVDISPMFGLTIETLIVSPIALIFLVGNQVQTGNLPTIFTSTVALLIGAGVATAVPLLLFASGAKRIPLSMVGFLQYLAPTIMLLIGVFMYNEPFTNVHLVSFAFIWTALAIYTASKSRWFKQMETKSEYNKQQKSV